MTNMCEALEFLKTYQALHFPCLSYRKNESCSLTGVTEEVLVHVVLLIYIEDITKTEV